MWVPQFKRFAEINLRYARISRICIPIYAESEKAPSHSF